MLLLNDLGSLYSRVHWKRYIYSRMYLTPSERQNLSRSSLYLYMRNILIQAQELWHTRCLLPSFPPAIRPSFLPSYFNFLPEDSSPCPAIAVTMYLFTKTKCQRKKGEELRVHKILLEMLLLFTYLNIIVFKTWIPLLVRYRITIVWSLEIDK